MQRTALRHPTNGDRVVLLTDKTDGDVFRFEYRVSG